MSSVFQRLNDAKQSLPVSRPDTDGERQAGIRRRLSSLSLKLQPCSSPAAVSWAFARSKSLPSMGEYAGGSIKRWWRWGWSWFLSRKPTFARDLELNEEETAVLGCHHRGSWRHVFYKVRSALRRLLGSDNIGLPKTFRYDSSDYSKNFDNGN